MVAEILFEIAVCVFVFLLLGIVATIFEFRKFIHSQDKSWPEKQDAVEKKKEQKQVDKNE